MAFPTWKQFLFQLSLSQSLCTSLLHFIYCIFRMAVLEAQDQGLIGLGCGIFILLVVVSVVLFFVWRGRRRRRMQDEEERESCYPEETKVECCQSNEVPEANPSSRKSSVSVQSQTDKFPATHHQLIMKPLTAPPRAKRKIPLKETSTSTMVDRQVSLSPFKRRPSTQDVEDHPHMQHSHVASYSNISVAKTSEDAKSYRDRRSFPSVAIDIWQGPTPPWTMLIRNNEQ